MLSTNRSFQAQNSTCSTLLQTMMLYETCIVLCRKCLWDAIKNFWHQWHSLVITTLSARIISKFQYHIYRPYKSSFDMERLLEILQKRDNHEREGTNFTLKQFDGIQKATDRRTSFLKVFSHKGWSSSRYAYNFKYISGVRSLIMLWKKNAWYWK